MTTPANQSLRVASGAQSSRWPKGFSRFYWTMLATCSVVVAFVLVWVVQASINGQGFLGNSVGRMPILAGVTGLGMAVFVGLYAVVMLPSSPRSAVPAIVLSLAAVALFSPILFAYVEAEHFDTPVLMSDGLRHTAWVATDTVPILKVDDALGLQPMEAPTEADGSPRSGFTSTPVGWWAPSILVRAATVFVLLAGLRAGWRYLNR